MTTHAALRKIAEGIYELADALFAESAVGELGSGSSAGARPSEVAAPGTARPSITTSTTQNNTPTTTFGMPEPFEELAAEVFPQSAPAGTDEGSAAMCPKHRIPYTKGAYGEFCKSTTDDPAWGKAKGDKLWCRITPKNAAEWLRITAAA